MRCWMRRTIRQRTSHNHVQQRNAIDRKTRPHNRIMDDPNPNPTTNRNSPQANQVNATHKIPELVAFAHAALFSPSLTTLRKAVNTNFLHDFPGLTTKSLKNYPPITAATGKGHFDQTRQNVRPTVQPPTNLPLLTDRRSRRRHLKRLLPHRPITRTNTPLLHHHHIIDTNRTNIHRPNRQISHTSTKRSNTTLRPLRLRLQFHPRRTHGNQIGTGYTYRIQNNPQHVSTSRTSTATTTIRQRMFHHPSRIYGRQQHPNATGTSRHPPSKCSRTRHTHPKKPSNRRIMHHRSGLHYVPLGQAATTSAHHTKSTTSITD